MKILLKTNQVCYCNQVRKFCSSKLKPPWNVLFLGSDKFSLPSLRVLHEEYQAKNSIISKLEVLTTSERNLVYRFASGNSLKVHTWPLQLDSVHHRSEFDFHIGLVVSFGKLIPKHIIDAFPMGMINVHASLLPRWRGAAPIIHALAAGDDETGVTIMKIRPHKFDIGEMIHQERVDIGETTRMPELHDILSSIGAKNLLKVLKSCPQALFTALPQDAARVTQAPRVTAAMAKVDFALHSAKQLFNLSRALSGLYPLLLSWDAKVVKIHNVTQYAQATSIADVPPVCGRLEYVKDRKLLRISVKDGWIYVDKISISGKRMMNATEFSNGFVKNTHLLLSS